MERVACMCIIYVQSANTVYCISYNNNNNITCDKVVCDCSLSSRWRSSGATLSSRRQFIDNAFCVWKKTKIILKKTTPEHWHHNNNIIISISILEFKIIDFFFFFLLYHTHSGRLHRLADLPDVFMLYNITVYIIYQITIGIQT